MPRLRLLAIAIAIAASSCFDPSQSARGLPCTSDASCGDLTCAHGYCGGPPVCENGAKVGDQCYVVGQAGIAVGEGPAAMAIGDVDGDFVADVVTANAGDGTISTLRGAGSSLELVGSTPSGLTAPDDVTLAPIHGGPWVDVIVTQRDTGEAAWLDPGGDTGEPTAIELGSASAGARHPFATDLDLDGISDLVLLFDDAIATALGDGAGGFMPADPMQLDGAQDFQARYDPLTGMISGFVVAQTESDVLTVVANEAGALSLSTETIPSGPTPYFLELSFHDTTPELDYVIVGDDGTIRLVAGEPGGWQEPADLYGLGFVPHALAVGPLDRDLDWDLAIVGENANGSRDVYLLDNTGDGELEYGGSLGLADASDVAIHDVDSDGTFEVLVSRASENEVVVIGRIQAPIPDTGDPSMPGDDDVADDGVGGSGAVDDDGGTGMPADDGVDTFPPGCPASGFGPYCLELSGQYALGIGAIAMEQTDADADGVADLVALEQGPHVVYVLGASDGTFYPLQPLVLSEIESAADAGHELAVGDLDGVGLVDLAVTTDGGVHHVYSVGVWDGTTAPTVRLGGSAASSTSPVIANFDSAAGNDVVVSTLAGPEVYFSADFTVAFTGPSIELRDLQWGEGEESVGVLLGLDFFTGDIYLTDFPGEATIGPGAILQTGVDGAVRMTFVDYEGSGVGPLTLDVDGALWFHMLDADGVAMSEYQVSAFVGTQPTRMRRGDLDCDGLVEVAVTLSLEGEYRTVMLLPGGAFQYPTHLIEIVDAFDVAFLPGDCGAGVPGRLAVLAAGRIDVLSLVPNPGS